MGYFASSLHTIEEKFGCSHGSKTCLGDLNEKPYCTKLPVTGCL